MQPKHLFIETPLARVCKGLHPKRGVLDIAAACTDMGMHGHARVQGAPMMHRKKRAK